MQIGQIPQLPIPTAQLLDVTRVLPQVAQATSSPMMASAVAANEKGGRSNETRGRQESSKKSTSSSGERGRSVNIKV